jgi:DNA-binding response OmpR family regulator
MKSFYLENEEMLQRVVSQVFEQSAHEIYTKSAKEEWLYLVLDLSPDLLIIDHDSLADSFAGGWQEIFSTQIPVVLICSEQDQVSDQIQGHENIRSILSKPFAPYELLKTVENILVSH